ncbi:MAG: hypothetical protein IRY95_06885 [Clostridia bacterium]|nr:hypothetical protein [Clostridia bacterium]
MSTVDTQAAAAGRGSARSTSGDGTMGRFCRMLERHIESNRREITEYGRLMELAPDDVTAEAFRYFREEERARVRFLESLLEIYCDDLADPSGDD